jgi:hypothetical protein
MNWILFTYNIRIDSEFPPWDGLLDASMPQFHKMLLVFWCFIDPNETLWTLSSQYKRSMMPLNELLIWVKVTHSQYKRWIRWDIMILNAIVECELPPWDKVWDASMNHWCYLFYKCFKYLDASTDTKGSIVNLC